jgi:hypothetical protein
MNSAFVLSSEPAAIDTTGFPQVIRRDVPGDASGKPRVVPWLGHKIAKAVAAACHAVGQDEILGQQVQAEIEYRVKRERPSFVHIEQIQDMVEETLIEIGQAKVALAYGKYRARRAVQREHGVSEVGGSSEQLELATHEQLADMRGRISFAKIGLRLTMDDNDLLARLLRSTSLGLTLDERRATIILNAKSLLDFDADARFFAARILLSYIYEETLFWTVAEGPQALKEAHRRAFLDYIPYGISRRRLDPRLAEFDLKKLAASLDPFADLQFDFIGVQTLFDRYLIHVTDAVTGRKRRLEAPQVFWLRVAMGLALLEEDRDARAIEFYSVYKSRRACSSTQFRHAALPAFELLPALLRGQHRGDSRDVAAFFSALEMGGWSRLLLDWRPCGRRTHSRHERRKRRRHPLSESIQRYRHRCEPGRKTSRRPLQLPGTLACGYRGFSRPAQGDRRRTPPHTQHEHSALDSRPVHETPEGDLRRHTGKGRHVDPFAHQRLPRPAGALWPRI